MQRQIRGIEDELTLDPIFLFSLLSVCVRHVPLHYLRVAFFLAV